ncbi:MAG: class I SAM-dependent methyltransferase [Prevotellaceae bacterium]|jgi:23S rRNA (cytosine1962-C5)-methyltransferase|nr:class I SAM-dependent methyltransferase [Prevotellaceae bacterium]
MSTESPTSSDSFHVLSPDSFKDYELIDCGGFEKLERFGRYVTRRPEPKAVWASSLPEDEWRKLAHATFRHEKGAKSNPDERGTWTKKSGMPDRWLVNYRHGELDMALRLGLTSFKHVGVFPEQAANWDFIYRVCRRMKKGAKVLNLFAYTGGASLAACAAGADVTHLDSIKQTVTWANDNMQASRLDGIRWLVDDALKYVQRQVRRGTKYSGIILDPPAYGRGPDGERWLLSEGILELLSGVEKMLESQSSFLVLNLYAMGFSSVVCDTLVGSVFGRPQRESGELALKDRFGKLLPLSVFTRFARLP